MSRHLAIPLAAIHNDGMETTATQCKFLARKPGSVYHQLYIKGRRIAARTLYGQFMSAEEPRTVEQLAEDYELPVEVVREAIAYCQSDPPEIRQDFAYDEAMMEACGMNDPGYKLHNKPRILSRKRDHGVSAAILPR